MARRTERYKVRGANSLWHVYRTVPFLKVCKNFLVIQLCRYIPFLPLKNWMYRLFLKMEVGEQTAIALMVMMDVMFPERIRIGKNSIIGYNTTILCHEYLIDEYRIGDVRIGDRVMIGANSTLLPGIEIGDGAVIGAGSLVNRDIPPGVFAAGNPVRIIRHGNGTEVNS
jgi:acetyltransferase-like isoleucine patch superfamily enzyme